MRQSQSLKPESQFFPRICIAFLQGKRMRGSSATGKINLDYNKKDIARSYRKERCTGKSLESLQKGQVVTPMRSPSRLLILGIMALLAFGAGWYILTTPGRKPVVISAYEPPIIS